MQTENKNAKQQYFSQLKTIQKFKNVDLAHIINIITKGQITIQSFKKFAQHIKKQSPDQNIDLLDWRSLTADKFYQILLGVQLFVQKNKNQQNTLLRISMDSKKQYSLKSFASSGVRQFGIFLDAPANNSLINSNNKNNEKDKQKQVQQKWKKTKIKLVKKLLIIFQYFRKRMEAKNQSFEKIKQSSEIIDIHMFMKYFKEFDLLKAFSLQNVTKSFKNKAINRIWLNFQRFVQTHLEIIGFNEQLTSEEKYLKLRGLKDLLKSQILQKFLNTNSKTIIATLHNNEDVYKQQIIQHLKRVRLDRKQFPCSQKNIVNKRDNKQIQNKKVRIYTQKTQNKKERELNTERNIHHSQSRMQNRQKIKVSQILKKRNSKSAHVYSSQHLPKIIQHKPAQTTKINTILNEKNKNKDGYKLLKELDLKKQIKKLKSIINYTQNEQYLDLYLKKEQADKKMMSKSPIKYKPQLELPSFKFS